MNPSEDPIEALLREQNNYVDDNGFTGRVDKALPRRRGRWLRPAILLSATGIGAVLAVCWLPWSQLPKFDLPALVSGGSQALLPWLTVILVVAALIGGAVAALKWEE